MKLPIFGIGTASIGNLYRPISDSDAAEVLARALDAGFRLFDTAPYYGMGLAEMRLGRALVQAPQDIILSTKVGRLLVPSQPMVEDHGFVTPEPFVPRYDYTAAGIEESYRQSLRRLQGRRVNILLAHDLGMRTHGEAHNAMLADFLRSGYSAMRALKDAGAIDAIGVGVNEVEVVEEILDAVALDVILLAGRYTLLDRTGERLLDRCRSLGVQVIIGGPFNSGILADPDAAIARFDYRPADEELRHRVHALQSAATSAGVSLPHAALQFPLTHPAVSSVVAGIANVDELSSFAAHCGSPIDAAVWNQIAPLHTKACYATDLASSGR